MTKNTNSANRLALRALAVATALVVSACGGDSTADDAEPASETVDMTTFLVQDNEEPGFRQEDSPRTVEGVDAFAAEVQLTDEETETLRGLGFVSFTVAFISGPAAAGVSNVQLFEDATGAEEWMAHDVSDEVIRMQLPDAEVERFSVDSIPGSSGWTSTVPDGPPVANVLWVQGRCVLTLGNQGPGDLISDLTTGAEAIYRRTDGECP